MLKLTASRISLSSFAALLISSATWADISAETNSDNSLSPSQALEALDAGGGRPGGGHPGGGHPGGGHPGGGHPGGGHPGGGHPGGGHPGGGHPGGGHPVVITHPGHTIPHTHPSHLGNPHTVNNINHAKQHIGSIHHSPGVMTHMHGKNQWFGNKYGGALQVKYNSCKPYYNNNQYKFYYSGWFNHGFCGGFYYPVRPWWGINEYFYYPTIYWLYVDIGNDDIPYYQTVYGNEYNSCPVKAFEYARVYFPTDNLRDLGIEMSALRPALQCNFRSAMLTMTESLQAQISDMLAASFTFGEYSVVVNHYENLQNQGVVLEGFVDQGDLHVAFKGILDLVNPDNTLVFLPKGQDPTAAELNLLDDMNDKIRSLGGNPDQVNLEPENVNP